MHGSEINAASYPLSRSRDQLIIHEQSDQFVDQGKAALSVLPDSERRSRYQTCDIMIERKYKEELE